MSSTDAARRNALLFAKEESTSSVRSDTRRNAFSYCRDNIQECIRAENVNATLPPDPSLIFKVELMQNTLNVCIDLIEKNNAFMRAWSESQTKNPKKTTTNVHKQVVLQAFNQSDSNDVFRREQCLQIRIMQIPRTE
jgi:hypothetical protein